MTPRSALPDSIRDLIREDARVEQARKRLVEQFRACFPVGSQHRYKHGSNTISVMIRRHCGSWWSGPFDVEVENTRTDKIYMIDGHRLLRFLEGRHKEEFEALRRAEDWRPLLKSTSKGQ